MGLSVKRIWSKTGRWQRWTCRLHPDCPRACSRVDGLGRPGSQRRSNLTPFSPVEIDRLGGHGSPVVAAGTGPGGGL
jgi:hypothetical protein